jgi:hypothetical protein
MDPRDDDIDFDFFEDEPATTEAQSAQARVRLPRRGGRGTGMRRPGGPPRGLTPFVRLLGAVVVLVVLFVFFGLAIQSCASTSKHDAYASYMSAVAKIGHSSQADGTAFANALTTPGVKIPALVQTLDGIVTSERQNLAQAEKVDPPGKLRPENQQVIDALQLRIDGVQGIARTLQQVSGAASTTGDAATLAEQAARLSASDIVWSDLFHDPAFTQLTQDGVKDVQVPPSQFVVNSALVTEHSLSGVLQRLKGAATGGKPSGLHGTNLVSVKAIPGNLVLQEGTTNTVTATTGLAFVVTIADSGDFQEVDIKVTLTIPQNTPVITKTLTIPVINPGTQKSVTFTNLGGPTFARTEQLNVDVAAVPGEVRVDNNKASYPVIFSLG